MTISFYGLCMCVKIYALKPYEADIGSISPASDSASGRGTVSDDIIGDVIIQRDAAACSNSRTKL